jgi:hypothetical protein
MCRGFLMSRTSSRLPSCHVPESLRIEFEDNKHAFRPGDQINGRVEWTVDEIPTRAAVCLCWSTRGKGSEDSEIVSEHVLENPRSNDSRPFSFLAPDHPYSFSGQLISLIWAVELDLEPGDLCDRAEITIGPDGREVELPGTVPEEKAAEVPTVPVR